MEVVDVADFFEGSFVIDPEALQEKLLQVKAYVFDWDGVFNNGVKDASGSSPFSEVDAMGTNMLRFSHYLRTAGSNAITVIISGEQNEAARTLAKREHFHRVYSGVKDKKEALQHLCDAYGIGAHEVAFFFDDVLDLSIAELCGMRAMLSRQGSPMFTHLVLDRKLADYITYAHGGRNGLREATELLMGLSGSYEDTIMQRVGWHDNYDRYITQRNKEQTTFYAVSDGRITEIN